MEKIETILENKYKENGYITSREILKLIEENNISISEIDKLTNRLLLKGIIILDEEDDKKQDIKGDEDWSHLDYNAIFNKVIRLEPEVEPYIETIRNIKPPQKGEEKQLLIQAKEGNPYAKTRLIEMHLKIVVKLAWYYYKKYKLNIVDSIETGNIGLIEALYKIDLSTSERFSTYMFFRIKTQIEREALLSNNAIYFSAHAKEKILPMLETVRKHSCTQCSEDEMCANLLQQIQEKNKMTKEEIQAIYILLQDTIDIDKLEEECILDDEEERVDELNSYFIQKEMQKCVKNLKDREAQVLQLRYGILEEGKERTLNEVGVMLGVTRERVRQIEEKAIRKMRANKKMKELIQYKEEE